MAQEIVDVSGQTGNQILQTLNKRGIQTSLLNLVQSTGAESARNIPRFIIVEDGQVKGGTDTQPQTEPQTAMDLKPADIVQETKIDRQPIPRQRPIVRNTVQQDLDTLELTDDSIKSALQQNLQPEPVAETVNQTDLTPPTVLEGQGEIVATDTAESKKTQFPGAGLRPLLGSDQTFIGLTDPVTTYVFENTLYTLGLPYALSKDGDLMYRSSEEMSGLQTEAKASFNNAVETLGFTPPFTKNENIKKAVNQVVKNLPEEQKKDVDQTLIDKTIDSVKNFILPGGEDPDPTQGGAVPEQIADIAISKATDLQKPAVSPTTTPTDTTEDTTVTKVTNESGVKQIIEDEDAANAVIEIAETEFMFEDGLDVTALQDINEEIKANNEKLLQISEGKIQPYFGKEDTGRKFLAAIAAGLGAYASAMTGTPNFALNIINKAIDDDLAIQKEQLERQRTSLLTQNEILAQRKAELYAEADRLFERQTTIAGLELEDKRLNQASKEAILAYNAELAKNRLSQDELTRLRTVKLVGNQVGEFGESMSKEKILKVFENFNTFIGGYMKIMGNPDSNPAYYDLMDDDYKRLVSYKESNKGLIEQLIDIAEAQPVQAKISVTEAGKKVRQLHALLKSYYQREIAQAGANLTGTEVVIIDRIVGDPDVKDLAFGTYVSGLKNLQNEMRRTYRDSLVRNDVVNIRTRGQQNQQGTQKKRRFDASKAQKVGNISQ